MLGHHPRNVRELDAPDALLPSGALPVFGGNLPEPLEVARAGRREREESFGEIAPQVHALARDAIPFEVRKDRFVLRQQTADPDAVGLALEIGEVPDVLD